MVEVTEAEYCSEICGAKCCKSEWALKKPCPQLGPDNLCKIYETRLGQRHDNETLDGKEVLCVCLPIQEGFDFMPDEVVEQCCHKNPELLNQPDDWRETLQKNHEPS